MRPSFCPECLRRLSKVGWRISLVRGVSRSPVPGRWLTRNASKSSGRTSPERPSDSAPFPDPLALHPLTLGIVVIGRKMVLQIRGTIADFGRGKHRVA